MLAGVGGPDAFLSVRARAREDELGLSRAAREFLARLDAQIDQIKQGERLPGVDELVVPGERGQRRWLDLTARAVVPLEPAVWQALEQACESLRAPLPTVRAS